MANRKKKTVSLRKGAVRGTIKPLHSTTRPKSVPPKDKPSVVKAPSRRRVIGVTRARSDADIHAEQVTQHVLRKSSGSWAVKRGGAARSTKVFDNKSEAIAHGRRLASSQNATLYIHAKDGRVSEKRNYSKTVKGNALKKSES